MLEVVVVVRTWQGWRLLACLFLILAAASSASASTLSQTPLFLAGKPDPNLMVDLSVEWPTGETAAYSDAPGTDPGGLCPGQTADPLVGKVPGYTPAAIVGVCYFENQTYVGYFDPAKCYSYDNTAHRFNPLGSATPSHECTAAWSGNFLNWATMTTLDEFRWAMTGGTRDVDAPAQGGNPAQTVLKQAYKAYGPNDYVFRVKRITATPSVVNGVTVPGVPTSRITPLLSDRTLYLGSNQGFLWLWAAQDPAPPMSAVACASNGGTCVLPSAGSWQVWYGAGTSWASLSPVAGGGSVGCTTGVFGDPAPGFSKSCLYAPAIQDSGFVGDASAPVSTPVSLPYLGGVQVRVAVCVPSVGMEANCVPYDNQGVISNKPTGLMQIYANTMRFSVASYLFDGNPAHNGGVLRANMKYVGPITKDPTSGSLPNPAQEWDANGVFVPNPNPADASASGIACSAGTGCSGVINFINGFGYAAQGYMHRDVLSELYFESLRYFVEPGNGPTPSYINPPWTGGLTPAQTDGFPVIKTWQDPIQYACQANAIVTIADANTWCDFNLPGSSLSENVACGAHANYGPAPGEKWADTNVDVTAFTNAVGASEMLGNLGTTWGNSGGIGSTYYIAGLAWWAHTHDIRKDTLSQPNSIGLQNVTSYFVDVREPGSWGTYGSPKNQLWLAAKYGGFNLEQSPPEAAPIKQSDWSADGRNPSNYYYGNQPLGLIAGLANAFNTIAAGGSQAALAGNSSTLQAGSKIFQSVANPSDWSGQFRAYDLTAGGGVSTTYVDAGRLLSAPVAANRVIFTVNGDSGGGVPFEWNKLAAAQQQALNTAPGGGIDNRGSQRLDYLRGDSSNEGALSSNFRPRSRSKLGDIVDSAPAFVGAVKPDGSVRSAMVYVGANDGMLHAFSAGAAGDTTTTPGTTLMQERFAYVPGTVIANLSQLTALGYAHQFYVDGSPQVVEAAIAGSPRTVLAGGLRAGGAGVFALDVTSPDDLAGSESAASTALLWEFTASHDPDLGATFSDPQIVQTAAVDGHGNPRWAVIIGNGYKSPLPPLATNTQAALFVLFLDHPSGGKTFVPGVDYIKLSTWIQAASNNTPNGLATPAVVPDSAGRAAIVYAGDLYGNLWKFDLASSDPASWKSALDPGQPALTPLFTAQTPTGVPQAITSAPEVVRFPLGGYMVLFGTGSALGSSELADTGLQTIYGIHDNLGNVAIPGRASGHAALFEQKILGSVQQVGNGNGRYRVLSSSTFSYAALQGWFLDLIDSPGSAPAGERVIFNPQVYQKRVIFSTVTPANAICSGGGASWSLSLDPYSGSGPSFPLYDLDGNAVFNAQDSLQFTSSGVTSAVYPGGVSTGNAAAPPPLLIALPTGCGSNLCHEAIQTGSDGSTSVRLENDGPRWTRKAWREVIGP